MKYCIKLSYDGAGLSGWQVQRNAPSVQEKLQNALSLLLGEEVAVTGAGRTDAGVNAVNYVAHFALSTDKSFDAERISYKINAILPKNVTVHKIYAVTDEFHARFSAKSREYHYFIHRRKDPFIEKFSYLCHYDLDIEKMNKAASFLLGCHDFSCFEKIGGNNATSICTVTQAHWDLYKPTHVQLLGYPCQEGDYIVFTIRADRFLRNMVRAVVGTLVRVGRGKMNPETIITLLESGSRSDAGESVPGHALFFNDVVYPMELICSDSSSDADATE